MFAMTTEAAMVFATIIIALETLALVGVTIWYAYSTRCQLDLLREQGKRLDEQDQMRVRRAIQAIVTEILINDLSLSSSVSTPLMCDIFPSSIWVFSEVAFEPSNRGQSPIY